MIVGVLGRMRLKLIKQLVAITVIATLSVFLICVLATAIGAG